MLSTSQIPASQAVRLVHELNAASLQDAPPSAHPTNAAERLETLKKNGAFDARPRDLIVANRLLHTAARLWGPEPGDASKREQARRLVEAVAYTSMPEFADVEHVRKSLPAHIATRPIDDVLADARKGYDAEIQRALNVPPPRARVTVPQLPQGGPSLAEVVSDVGTDSPQRLLARIAQLTPQLPIGVYNGIPGVTTNGFSHPYLPDSFWMARNASIRASHLLKLAKHYMGREPMTRQLDDFARAWYSEKFNPRMGLQPLAWYERTLYGYAPSSISK